MTLLSQFPVVQIGPGAAAAVCGRLLADVGASVSCIEPDTGSTLLTYLNHAKRICDDRTSGQAALAAARLIVREGEPHSLAQSAFDLPAIRRCSATAAIVTISPYGLSGPLADASATDLTLFYASGVARLLTGQVDDLGEPPIRPVGEQS